MKVSTIIINKFSVQNVCELYIVLLNLKNVCKLCGFIIVLQFIVYGHVALMLLEVPICLIVQLVVTWVAHSISSHIANANGNTLIKTKQCQVGLSLTIKQLIMNFEPSMT